VGVCKGLVRAKASKFDEPCESSAARRRFGEGAAGRTAARDNHECVAARPVSRSLSNYISCVVVVTLVGDGAEKEPCVVGGSEDLDDICT
jgi:hypothetical protein